MHREVSSCMGGFLRILFYFYIPGILELFFWYWSLINFHSGHETFPVKYSFFQTCWDFLCGLNFKKWFIFFSIIDAWGGRHPWGPEARGFWSPVLGSQVIMSWLTWVLGIELYSSGGEKKHALLTTVSSYLSPLLWHFIINFVVCYCWPSAVSTRIFSLLRSSGSTLLFCLCLHWVLEYLYFQLWLWIRLTLFLFLVKFHFIHFESMLLCTYGFKMRASHHDAFYRCDVTFFLKSFLT